MGWVLLVNDDGFRAPGLQVMQRSLTAAGIAYRVVAPRRNHSGRSHAVSLTGQLHVVQDSFGVGGLTVVKGTPVDCVRLALAMAETDRPRVVLAGVNEGWNIGAHLLASATAASAREAACHGIPALAVSAPTRPDWVAVEALLDRHLITWLDLAQREQGWFLNINLPGHAPASWAWSVPDPRPMRLVLAESVPSPTGTWLRYGIEPDPIRPTDAPEAPWDGEVLAAGEIAVSLLRGWPLARLPQTGSEADRSTQDVFACLAHKGVPVEEDGRLGFLSVPHGTGWARHTTAPAPGGA